ncbi:hypothetical protein [uncultured Fibrobacter sp.]|nr:hypothetical protein [uncultured Fibrobacter sp.]
MAYSSYPRFTSWRMSGTAFCLSSSLSETKMLPWLGTLLPDAS